MNLSGLGYFPDRYTTINRFSLIVTGVLNPLTEVSRALLRSWLSPDQLRDYNEYGYFFVIGGTTGTKYRVHDWLQRGEMQSFNITSYRDGKLASYICFEPTPLENGLAWPIGDVLLTQKLALEQDEPNTLMRANYKSAFVERSSGYEQFITATPTRPMMLVPGAIRYIGPSDTQPSAAILYNSFANTAEIVPIVVQQVEINLPTTFDQETD